MRISNPPTLHPQPQHKAKRLSAKATPFIPALYTKRPNPASSPVRPVRPISSLNLPPPFIPSQDQCRQVACYQSQQPTYYYILMHAPLTTTLKGNAVASYVSEAHAREALERKARDYLGARMLEFEEDLGVGIGVNVLREPLAVRIFEEGGRGHVFWVERVVVVR